MAFISEEIKNEKDKEYFNSIALKSMTGQILNPRWWTIDREKNIILYERGGGAFEIPIGYGLYIGGDSIKIEVAESTKGSRYENNLMVYYFIKRIEIPQNLIEQDYQIEKIINIIEDAFKTMGVPYVERARILEVNVKIMEEPEIV